jgi:hypothetical protein
MLLLLLLLIMLLLLLLLLLLMLLLYSGRADQACTDSTYNMLSTNFRIVLLRRSDRSRKFLTSKRDAKPNPWPLLRRAFTIVKQQTMDL